jgi:RNA polymerase primary sigma factor
LPVLKAAEQKALARRMRDTRLPKAVREAARTELIEANLRFAFSIAKQYQNRGLPLEDLVSEANAGLCRAADKYDPDVGVNFISYAVWWIRQALSAAVATKPRSVRLPLNRAGDLSRVVRAQALLREKLGREPSAEEIARVCSLSVDVAESLLGLAAAERSLDDPVPGRGRGGTRTQLLGDVLRLESDTEDARLPGGLEEESRRAALDLALAQLPPRDRKVLRLYYGLETGEPMTLNDIAGMLGVTRERVRQLRERALQALRSAGSTDVLRDWAA